MRRRAVNVDELWVEVLAGSKEARDALTVHYLPLVREHADWMARRHRAGVEPSDLEQWGTFGLMEAIGRYDPTRGRFETFARWRIRGAMQDGLREYDVAPFHYRDFAASVTRARDELAQQLGRWPTDAELEAVVEPNAIALQRELELAARPMLVAFIPGEEANGYGGGISADLWGRHTADVTGDEAVGKPLVARLADHIADIISAMPERQRRAFEMRYFEDAKYAEIAAALGVSVPTVSSIVDGALVKIRDGIRDALK